jgi:hypothetical protein
MFRGPLSYPQVPMTKAARPPKASLPQNRRAEERAAATLRAPAPSPDDIARTIAQFTAELSALAKQARLDLLAYLLDMAHLEASRGDRGAPPLP